MRLHSWTSYHDMEQPVVRSRTSPPSTFGISNMPKSPPVYVWHAVKRVTKRGRLPCVEILVSRGRRGRVCLYSSSTSITGYGRDIGNKKRRRGKRICDGGKEEGGGV